MITMTSRGTKEQRKIYSQISVSLLPRRVEDFPLKCKVFPPTLPDQGENVRVGHIVAPHECAVAILIGTCVGDIFNHMALLDATATVSYPHSLRNAYKQDYGTEDCFTRHFLLTVPMSANIKAFNANVVNVNGKGCKKAKTEERLGRAQIAS